MDKINPSIECTVPQCKYNDREENGCTLNKIVVGSHEANPSRKDSVDCNSFEME